MRHIHCVTGVIYDYDLRNLERYRCFEYSLYMRYTRLSSHGYDSFGFILCWLENGIRYHS